MAQVNRTRLRELRASEEQQFLDTHPRSLALFERAKSTLVGGVPMNWMQRWPGGIPIFVEEAADAHFVDVDGHTYIDFCLGDTGAMTGHTPAATVDAIARQAAAASRRCSRPKTPSSWGSNFRSASACRLADRDDRDRRRPVRAPARAPRNRPRQDPRLQLVLSRHGRRDARHSRRRPGRVAPRKIGPPVDPALTTKIIEFNDVEALEAALAPGDVACVLAEPRSPTSASWRRSPASTTRSATITRRTGTLLVIDETHTICIGPGGATRKWGLDPDFFVIGKPIAGGLPAAAFGMTAALAEQLAGALGADETDVSGIGGTLTGNALALAAIRATLESTLLADDYARMIPLAQRWADGVRDTFSRRGLPWSVNQLGARAEYWFSPPPRNGAEAAAAVDEELDSFMHLWALNRQILLTPFHNMALMSPATTAADVDAHTAVFAAALDALT